MPRRRFSSKKCLCISVIVFFAISIILYYSLYDPPNEYKSFLNKLAREKASFLNLNLTCQAPNKPFQDCQPVIRLASRFPKALIIGFGKAGTRALLNILLMHPSIQGPHIEMNYFDQYYRSEGLQWYLESFPPKRPNKINIEKSPQYIRTPGALSRLKSVLQIRSLHIPTESIKFIVIMKEPITRAISEYVEWRMQRAKDKAPDLPTFDQMVLQSEALPIFINTSEYDYHISTWLEYFRLDQFCFVDGELFIKDPFRVVEKLETCLGISSYFRKEDFVFNSEKGFYCFKTEGKVHCLNKSKGRAHPEISEETRKYLDQHFKLHNKNLVKITQQKFMWI